MANGKPHTHNAVLTRTYRYSETGNYLLEYGDQTVFVCFSWQKPTERRIRRAFRRAVRKHDRGSRQYDAKQTTQQQAKAHVSALNARVQTEQWASDVI